MTSSHDEEAVVEASLAAERTSLSWNRTSLAMLACGAAVVKGLPASAAREARPAVGAVIVVLAVATWLQAAWTERRRRAGIARGDLAAEPSALRAAALSAMAVGAVALGLAALA